MRRRSQLQERRVAEDLGGRVQPGSGAPDFYKGDVKAPGVRVECKTTGQAHYVLKMSDLDKITKEAMGALETPVMQIQFGVIGKGRNYAVISLHWFERMLTHAGINYKAYYPHRAHGISTRIKSDMLITAAAAAAGHSIWALKICFGPRQFESQMWALTSWEHFLELYKKFNEIPEPP